MSNLLLWTGRVAGGLGAIVVAVAVLARLAGTWTLGSVQVGTLLQLGIAGMVLACLAYCAEMAERPRRQ